jgi:hypothetical protein
LKSVDFLTPHSLADTHGKAGPQTPKKLMISTALSVATPISTHLMSKLSLNPVF